MKKYKIAILAILGCIGLLGFSTSANIGIKDMFDNSGKVKQIQLSTGQTYSASTMATAFDGGGGGGINPVGGTGTTNVFTNPTLAGQGTDTVTMRTNSVDISPTEKSYLDNVSSNIQTQLDTKLIKSNNLSDITATSTARTNLGLGTLATQSGTFSGTSSGTNTGDNATNSQYSSLVSNATHTGDVLGGTSTTVVGINGTLMSGLATGIVKNTTTTGVLSIAVAGDFPTLNQNTTGNAASVTTNANLTGHITSTGNATVLGSFSSANLAGALTDETGSGAAVFATSPALVTPVLGAASATSLAIGTTDVTYPLQLYNATDSVAGKRIGIVNALGGTTSLYRYFGDIVFNSAGDGSATIGESWQLGQDLLTVGTRLLQIRDIKAAGSPVRLTVDTSGNVGIGTVAPLKRLQVDANVAKATGTTTPVVLVGTNDVSNPLQLSIEVIGDATPANRKTKIQSVEQGVAYRDLLLNPDGGNVGIGTTNPSGQLHIAGSYSGDPGNLQLNIQRLDGITTFGGLRWLSSAGTKIWGIESNTYVGPGIEFNEGSTNRIYLAPGGNVGIGTTTPSNILTLPIASATDPIADAWTLHCLASYKEIGTETAGIIQAQANDKVKSTPVSLFTKKPIISDDEAEKEVKQKYQDTIRESIKIDLENYGTSTGVAIQDDTYINELLDSMWKTKSDRTALIEANKQKLISEKKALPKFQRKNYGIAAEDAPEEARVYTKDGVLQGVNPSVLISILWANAQNQEKRISMLEFEIEKLKVLVNK